MADILIVDDHEQIREVLREILQDESHTVREASNGSDALALARQRPPELVFLDLRMPDIDGLEVLRELRDDPRTKAARVVILTAHPESEPALDVEAYFTKPFSPLAVLELVERLTS